MTGLDLNAIRARTDAATPGPWLVTDHNEGECPPRPLWGVVNDAFLNPPEEDEPWIALEVHVGVKDDAEFIAHARDDVPALVDEVERLRVKVRALENPSSLRADAQQRRSNRKKIDADLMGLGRAGPWTS